MDLKDLKLTPKRQETLKRLEIESVEDLLRYYPSRYEDHRSYPFNEWKDGQMVTFEAQLINSPSTFRYGKRSSTRFRVLYDDEYLNIVLYNRPWIKLNDEDPFVIVGKYEAPNKVVATNYFNKPIAEIPSIQAIYPLKEGIKQSEIQKMIKMAYDKFEGELIDDLPSKYLKAHQLIGLKEALYEIHFPSHQKSLSAALSRLKYEEFLRFYVAMNLLKKENQEAKYQKDFDQEKIESFIQSLAFELTVDQRKALDEILDDLRRNRSMSRLLQGDVGCGKTIVAMIALYANALSGSVGVLMAPTEILAKQHYQSFKKELEPLGIKIGLLYSSLKDKKSIKEEIEAGNYDIIIGTHALFSEDVNISNLGFVITDEQQRFGVKQRKKLKEKGLHPDVLMMSATPIPRTLAASIYGDMDISTIETLPIGRKGSTTTLIKENSIRSILKDIMMKLEEGRQIYMITAAIEQSDFLNTKDATQLYESLIPVFKPYRLGLLHGKMSSEEKDIVMQAFERNEIQILISTTVVEVGVNVINATEMIVYDADRFGLSQLHQLRGRIQRGSIKGNFYLLTSSKDAEVERRLNTLVNSNNGFEIAMEDFKLRGPGDLLGTRQSGLPSFVLGDLLMDQKFVEAAKKDAKEIIENIEEVDNQAFCLKIEQTVKKNQID